MELGVLVIDDEDGIRRSLTRILREDGYSVSVASNGEEALSLIRNNLNSCDIVICDLLMPGIDGYNRRRDQQAPQRGNKNYSYRLRHAGIIHQGHRGRR